MTGIPDSRRSDDELKELRMRNAFAVRPPVQSIKAMALHPFFLAVAYVLCMAGSALALAGMIRSGLVCAALGLLLSLYIFWKKPRSRHHATIMLIISLLVLVFVTVYYLKQFEQTANDAQGPIRY